MGARKKVPNIYRLDLKTYMDLAAFMKSFFKVRPSATNAEMLRALKAQFNLEYDDRVMSNWMVSLLQQFRFIKHAFEHPDDIQNGNIDSEWVKIHWPIYDDLNEATSIRTIQSTSKKTTKPRSLAFIDAMRIHKIERLEENPSVGGNDTKRELRSNQRNDQPVNETVCRVEPILEKTTVEEEVLETKFNERLMETEAITDISKMRIEELKMNLGHEINLKSLEDKQRERDFEMKKMRMEQHHEIRKMRLKIKLEKYKHLNKTTI